SIDWLCVPRFDAPACFAALLGSPEHGRTHIAPEAAVQRVQRRYRAHTLILETDFDTDGGTVRVVDCMPLANDRRDIVRNVECLHGEIALRMELVIRFDYGHVVPWVRKTNGSMLATAGPDTLELAASVPTHGERMTTVARFTLRQGERASFVLDRKSAVEGTRAMPGAHAWLGKTEWGCAEWSARSGYGGRWGDATRLMKCALPINYGHVVPWVRKTNGSMLATAGPDTLELAASVPTHGERMTTVARFTLRQGERASFV